MFALCLVPSGLLDESFVCVLCLHHVCFLVYTAIHCPRQKTIRRAMQPTDIPPPQSAALGLHFVAHAQSITHFRLRWSRRL